MLYLLLGVGVAALLVWAGRKRNLSRGHMRLAAGAVALVALGGAIFVTLRGQYLGGAVLLALGAYLAPLARPVKPLNYGAPGGMSVVEAQAILGVGPGATRAEIQAAYKRLMRRAHPDQGGTTGLAAQLNAARDRLLS